MARKSPTSSEIRAAELASSGRALTAGPELAQAVATMVENLPASAATFDDIRKFLTSSLPAAIARRDIPHDLVCTPRADVVIPAIEALRYSSIRDNFMSLIAAAMDGRTANTILPAYVEILKQLSADELALLDGLPAQGRYLPIVDIVYVLPTEQVISAYRHVLGADVAEVCQHRANISQYVDNLVRLNLVHRPVGERAADVAYRPFARFGFVKRLMKAAPQRAQAAMDKGVWGLTDLGAAFRAACLG